MHTVLLVEAPEGDASVLASALRVEGFTVVQVATSAAAREALAELGGMNVAMAIVDLMVRGDAGETGLDLAREIRTRCPATRVVLTSAYHLSERQLERADCGVSGFIPKPYDVGEVVEFVRSKASSPPSSRRLWHAEAISGIVAKDDIVPAAGRGRR
jgi:DNA-binding NarL/FixJ family response regulator